jgi:GTP-binding protein
VITIRASVCTMRSSGADDKVRITPAIKMSLEEALEYIQADEYVEVTPTSLRVRKILLKETDRKRSGK